MKFGNTDQPATCGTGWDHNGIAQTLLAGREQSEPRQEREFWDRRQRVAIAAFPRTETGIGLNGDEKPRH